MANNRELSEFGSFVSVDNTNKTVGIATTVRITAGGLFVGAVQAIRPDGTWGGSTAGIQGAQGTGGVQGTTGTQGTTGAQGTTGTQGITGTQGATGSQGTTGAQGATGTQGAAGTQGTLGTQGAAGPSNVVSATAVTTNSTFYPVFVAGTGNQTPSIRTTSQAFQINPSTGNLQTSGTISAYNGVNAETVPFYRNSTTIASDYTVTTSYNEMSVGPIVINSGVTVTVNSGAYWSLV